MPAPWPMRWTGRSAGTRAPASYLARLLRRRLEDRLESTRSPTPLHQVHIHDLRHTFGVHCAKAGIPLARIQKLMGHATPVMTLRYLKHAPESYFSEDAARLAGSLTGSHDREVEPRPLS